MTTANVHRTPEELTAYNFQAPTDMIGALQAMVGIGFTGTITTYMDGQNLVWRMQIDQPGKDSLFVYLEGSANSDPNMPTVVVYSATSNELTVHTTADFTAKFVIDQVVSP